MYHHVPFLNHSLNMKQLGAKKIETAHLTNHLTDLSLAYPIHRLAELRTSARSKTPCRLFGLPRHRGHLGHGAEG